MKFKLGWMHIAFMSLAVILAVPWAIAQVTQRMDQNTVQGLGQGMVSRCLENMGQYMNQAMGPQHMDQGQGQPMGQPGQGMGQGHGQGMGMSQYDPSTVVTVKGSVEEVQQGTAGRQQMGGMGVHLLLKSDKGTQTVLVGPQSFLTQKNFSFSKGDQIEVTGSKIKYGTSEAIIAREIKKGDQTLTLRNEQGIPVWSGKGPR